jgi:hypothetical protein
MMRCIPMGFASSTAGTGGSSRATLLGRPPRRRGTQHAAASRSVTGAAGILGHPPTRVMTAWTLIHLLGVCAAAGGASDRPKAAAAKNGKETSDPLHGVLPNSCFRPMGSFNGRHWARRIRLSETRTGVSGKDLPGLSRGINQPGRGYRAAAHASMNANHSFLAVIDLTPSSVVLRIDPPIIPPTMTGIQ